MYGGVEVGVRVGGLVSAMRMAVVGRGMWPRLPRARPKRDATHLGNNLASCVTALGGVAHFVLKSLT